MAASGLVVSAFASNVSALYFSYSVLAGIILVSNYSYMSNELLNYTTKV